jgi:hypothetical protein
MNRHAWVDTDGVLIGHGYSNEHLHYICFPVPHEFNLTPLEWRLDDNGEWIPYARRIAVSYEPINKSIWSKLCSLIRHPRRNS